MKILLGKILCFFGSHDFEYKKFTASKYDGDLEFHAFTNKDKSISEARKMAKDYSDGRDYEEHDYDGFLFYANYSCEGDSVYAIKTELNENK